MATPADIRKFAKDAGLKIGDNGLLPEWAETFYEYGHEEGATIEGAIKRIMVCVNHTCTWCGLHAYLTHVLCL